MHTFFIRMLREVYFIVFAVLQIPCPRSLSYVSKVHETQDFELWSISDASLGRCSPVNKIILYYLGFMMISWLFTYKRAFILQLSL